MAVTDQEDEEVILSKLVAEERHKQLADALTDIAAILKDKGDVGKAIEEQAGVLKGMAEFLKKTSVAINKPQDERLIKAIDNQSAAMAIFVKAISAASLSEKEIPGMGESVIKMGNLILKGFSDLQEEIKKNANPKEWVFTVGRNDYGRIEIVTAKAK